MNRVSISRPLLDERAEKRVLEVLRSGHLAQGPMVAELEARFAALAGSRHAIAVSSGTAALEVALRLKAERAPDLRVLTTPFTFVATLNAALAAGASVRFADIGDDFNLDPASVAEQSTGIDVLLPVHLYGQVCDMDALVLAAPGASIVEDAAQAVAATHNGRPAGSFGVGCFSLYATKNVTTGEGGILTTSDDDEAAWVRSYINHGMTSRYEYAFPGRNLRMTDLQAALAMPQLDDLDQIVEARTRNASTLSHRLAPLRGVTIPTARVGGVHVWHQYTIRVSDGRRDALRAWLNDAGIDSGVYYPKPLHGYSCYRDHPLVEASETPNAHRVAAEVLSLPVHPSLSETDLDRIATAIEEFTDA